jgi:ABC-2 type transport system permease protein
MHGTLAVTRKELRSYFNSPIAYVFLVLFLGAALAAFFHDVWAQKQASLRGLFDALPLLLTFLVPALTMRLWSEERKLGTLEVLLTLPLRGGEVVGGKFLASLALLAMALLLTIGIPLTVSALGSLDWGPVIGGYFAALLLGAAYLAIGLVISSLTENQILAFLATLAVCFAFWIIGEEVFTRYFPVSIASVLEQVGTGSRFRSVGRGVLDLADLVYYGSIVAAALTANAAALEARKG